MEKDSSGHRSKGISAALNTSRFALRAVIITTVIVMLIFLASASIGDGLSAQAAPVAQDGTGYPIDQETAPTDEFEDESDGYPVGTDSPFEDETPFDETPFDFGTLEVPTITLTPTGTLPPNTFLTESAEMGSGQITPPPSETPGPTITVFQSPTAPAATRRAARVPTASESGGIDWGYFSLGFAVPLMAACGLVLYLLDRRPDLFRKKK